MAHAQLIASGVRARHRRTTGTTTRNDAAAAAGGRVQPRSAQEARCKNGGGALTCPPSQEMGGGHCACPPRRRGSEGDCREASRSVASRRMITCMQAGKGRSNSSNNRLTTDSTGGGSCGGSGGINRRAAVQTRKHGGVAATRPHIRHRQHDRRAARCRCPRARGWGTVAGEVRAGHRCAGRGHARRGGGGREQWSSGRRSGAGAWCR